MKKYKLYKYIGRNGEIVSPIFLENIQYIPLMDLRPENGYVLTDGQNIREFSVVVHIDDVENWKEVKADTIE